MSNCLLCNKHIIEPEIKSPNILPCHRDTISITTSLFFTLAMPFDVCVDCYTTSFYSLKNV